jgi:hypothetical protein
MITSVGGIAGRVGMDRRLSGRVREKEMTVKWCLGLVLGLALSACSDDPEVVDTGPKGNGVCLQTSQIDHTEIVNDSSIVFFMKTGKPFLNTLRFPCPSLKMEDGFAYETDFPEIWQFLRVGQFHAFRGSDPAAGETLGPG